MGEDILNLGASAAFSEFCELVQVEIDVYIPLHKYQVTRACATAIFVCTNRINLLNLKESSDRLVIIAKGFLKLPNLHMLIKQKNPSLPRSLAPGTFGKLLIVFSTKVNLLYLYSRAGRCCLLHLIKQTFAENFSKNYCLDNSGISLPVFLSRTNLKLHNISVIPKIVKKVITNLDSSKAFSHD